MKISEIKEPFPELYKSLQELGAYNDLQLNEDAEIPRFSEFLACMEDMLEYLSDDERFTVLDGESTKAEELLFSKFHELGESLNQFLDNIFNQEKGLEKILI